MSALLIADLHLDAGRPQTLAAALPVFADAQRFEQLWIIGDLFEAWIGDDAGLQDPVARQVVAALAATSASGTRVHLMHGNRDFLLGEDFARACGATLHRDDEVILALAGESVLLLHGDTLCTGDDSYLQLRAQVRDPAWQARMLATSVADRIAMAGQLRGASASANTLKSQDIMDVDDAAVSERLRAAGVRTMVHGHTHRPATHRIEPVELGDRDGAAGCRLVVGDWNERGGEVVVADAGGLRRVPYPFDAPLPSAG